MIETSKVSFLVFYWSKTEDRERRFASLLFSHAESMKRYLKIRRTKNTLLVVRVALKKMRILLYYYYSYYY
jgi:hypothetical protein